MEILYRIWREEGEEEARHALRLIDSFPIEWVSYEPAMLDIASRFKVQGSISVADSWIAATAVAREATLVHKDPEFRKFQGDSPGVPSPVIIWSRLASPGTKALCHGSWGGGHVGPRTAE